MYVLRDEQDNIIGYSRNAIPKDSDTGDNLPGWELCEDQEEVDTFLNQ